MTAMNDSEYYAELSRLSARCAELECELAAQRAGRMLIDYTGELRVRPVGRGITLSELDTSLEEALGQVLEVANIKVTGWTGRVRLRIELLEGKEGG